MCHSFTKAVCDVCVTFKFILILKLYGTVLCLASGLPQPLGWGRVLGEGPFAKRGGLPSPGGQEDPPSAAGSQPRNFCRFTPGTQFHSLQDFFRKPFSPLLCRPDATPLCPGSLNYSDALKVVRALRARRRAKTHPCHLDGLGPLQCLSLSLSTRLPHGKCVVTRREQEGSEGGLLIGAQLAPGLMSLSSLENVSES